MRLEKIKYIGLLISALLLQQMTAMGQPTYISAVPVSIGSPPANTYDITVVAQFDSQFPSGPLVSVANRGVSIPFQSIADTAILEIYSFQVSPLVDSFSETYVLTWTNFTYDYTFNINPLILTNPASQSVFVGSNVLFSAVSIHTSSYQWQKDGTNLVESDHFVGVTNSTLEISNVQMADAGDYIVMASNTNNSIPTVDAYLSVFKPIRLSLLKSHSDGSSQLRVNNRDGSPVDTNQVLHFVIYYTTNLSLSLSNWDIVTTNGVLSDGSYQVDFQDDGSPIRFWQVGQQL